MNTSVIIISTYKIQVGFLAESKTLPQGAKMDENWRETKKALSRSPLQQLIACLLNTHPQGGEIIVAGTWRDKGMSAHGWWLTSSALLLGFVSEGDLREGRGERRGQRARGSKEAEHIAVSDASTEKTEKRRLSGTSCFSQQVSHACFLCCSLNLTLTSSYVSWLCLVLSFYLLFPLFTL